MPGKVNRVPQGLLSLLDMKQAGENPHVLNEQLTAVLELTDLYLAPVRQVVNQSVATAAPGILLYPTLAPADGELWFVRQVTAVTAAVLPAAATLSFCIGFQPSGNAGFFVGLGDESPRIAAVGERAVSTSNQTAVLQPNDQMAIWITNFGGAPGSVRVTALVAKLKF